SKVEPVAENCIMPSSIMRAPSDPSLMVEPSDKVNSALGWPGVICLGASVSEEVVFELSYHNTALAIRHKATILAATAHQREWGLDGRDEEVYLSSTSCHSFSIFRSS